MPRRRNSTTNRPNPNDTTSKPAGDEVDTREVVTLDQFRDFVCAKAYDIISEVRYNQSLYLSNLIMYKKYIEPGT